MQLEALENQGYHFRLEGDRLLVRRYGGEIEKGVLDGMDRQQIVNSLKDRSAGFRIVDEQELIVESADLPVYCAKIKAALADGTLWDARAVYHRNTLRTSFFLTPPGVIQ